MSCFLGLSWAVLSKMLFSGGLPPLLVRARTGEGVRKVTS